MVDAGCGLLRDAIAVFQHFRVFGVNERSKISTIVKNEVQFLAVLECGELLLKTPVVLLLGLAFPCKADSGQRLQV